MTSPAAGQANAEGIKALQLVVCPAAKASTSIQPGAKFNLQLSGHTHGGQLFPFGLLVKIYFPKIYGLHKLGENKLLYISRGTGTWGPPVRVFAPPEITVIDLIGKK